MTKAEAGQKGGLATLKKYGQSHMIRLAKMGAAAFHAKYKLVKQGIDDFAIVDRKTGKPTGKTIKGLTL